MGRIIVKRPRMLSAEFVALYKPRKPKPNLNHIYGIGEDGSREIRDNGETVLVNFYLVSRGIYTGGLNEII